MTNLTPHRKRLKRLGAARERFHSEAPRAAQAAKDDGMEVTEIARLLGYKTRRSVYKLIGGACLALLVFTPGAWATDITDHPRIQRMQTIAEARFPAASRRCGSIAVEADSALLSTGGTYEGQQAGADDVFPCRVIVRDDWLALSRSRLCIVFVHEYGHLALGPEHSADPNDVMYEGGIRPAMVPACGLIEDREHALIQQERRAETLRYELRQFGHKAHHAKRAKARRKARAKWHRRHEHLIQTRVRIAILHTQLGP